MAKTILFLVKSPWFWAVLTGYMLRIFLMPITGQHDVMFMPWMTHYINQGHFNLYAFIFEKFGALVMVKPGVWAPYPYGFYALTAGWMEILDKSRLVSLAAWDSVWQVSQPARWVFLFKAAYIPFDLCIGYILYRYCGRIGLVVWAWSPTVIYTSYMMGQNDIYATAFCVAGTYAASKAIQLSSQNQSSSSWFSNKWAVWSCIFLGIGCTFKIFPIFFLPPLALLMEKSWRRRLILICSGCAFLALASLPFITTPTYINGVLLNPEGAKIFREIQLFGVSTSPFLIGYLILLGYLIITVDQTYLEPHSAWVVALLVLALLFLWVSTPFYWLIWITPLLIGTMGRIPKLLYVWALFQIAFALSIVIQHQELGAALPVHLAEQFNFPNLSTTLLLTSPTLYRIFITIVPIINSIQVFALLLMIWYACRALVQQRSSGFIRQKPRWWIGLPSFVMLSSIVAQIFFSRNLVSPINLNSFQNRTLKSGDIVLQELNLGQKILTGARLRFVESTPSATIQLCFYHDGNILQEALACVSKNTSEQVENQVLYFLFDKPLKFEANDHPTVKMLIGGTNAVLVLPYTPSTKTPLQFGDIKLSGSLDLLPLSSINISEALNRLFVENILKDTKLLGVIGIVTVLVVVFSGLLILMSQNIEKDPETR